MKLHIELFINTETDEIEYRFIPMKNFIAEKINPAFSKKIEKVYFEYMKTLKGVLHE